MATFKARARTLDMLGRQQIAGIPTAISELFKNAHDAYADHVEVDYYRSDGLFVLRDDGLGMTKQDFEDRWLTLGTESKLGTGKGLNLPPEDINKGKRPILGEKGIGRLAIASIGPQVLVLSKAKRVNTEPDLVAAFINWGQFELPGIDLDQIVIPIRTFPEGTFIEKNDLMGMVNEVKSNINILVNNKNIAETDSNRLLTQLDSFIIDPLDVDDYIDKLNLSKGATGTHFYIKPAYELLQNAIDGDKNDERVSPLLKYLIGFTNTTIKSQPSINARFRDHKTDDYYEELIGDSAFFTSKEFEMCDHHFQGTFDEYGQFSGNITIYGEKTFKNEVYWKEGFGKPTLCGPFNINVAYLQGSVNQSKLPPQDYAFMTSKLNKIGGLYIYKDGIRILPYGDSDYDFLDIEKRRTKGADYYYFSYRNMIGFIDITRERNPNLVEKAGREGFIQNKAYNQFKSILENYFIQLAADFFRPKDKGGSEKTEYFTATKDELKRLSKAKELAEKKATKKKIKFQNDLDNFFIKLKEGAPQKDATDLAELIEREFNIASEKRDEDESCQAFLDTESMARKKIDILRETYRITRPRGLVTSKRLQSDWEQYVFEYNKLETELFKPTLEKMENIANETIIKYNIVVDKRRRIQRSIQDATDTAKSITKNETYETRNIANEVQTNIVNLTQSIITETEDEITKTLSLFAKLDISKLDNSSLVDKAIELENPLLIKVEKNKEILKSLQDQLKNIVTVDEKGEIIPSSVDIAHAYENELMNLQEKADLDIDLSQLGMAISVIQHEFNGTVKSIRENIRKFKAWADVNEELYPLYTNIRTNFEHLDGYLTLFTPLNRRLYRNKIEITGIAIKDFLDDLFAERMRRHNIILESTNRFNENIIIGYPSTFYPVFVNVIDNAIFWLKDRPVPRKVKLDADENGILISNNGPDIPIRDREIIFDMGFTRKPAGRGLGLYISRQVLSKEGYTIFLDDPISEMTVTFRIESVITKNVEGDNI